MTSSSLRKFWMTRPLHHDYRARKAGQRPRLRVESLEDRITPVRSLGLFELDANAFNDGAVAGDDWNSLPGGAFQFTGILPDIGADGGTEFQGGGSKDDLDLSPGGATAQNWKWDPGEPLDKDDITNAYAAAYTNTTADGDNQVGDLIVYFGLDRFANDGSAQVGFWFFHEDIDRTNTKDGGGFLFSGHHVDGDILVQSNFTNGGRVDNVSVYEWNGPGGLKPGSGAINGTLDLLFSTADIASAALNSPVFATVNKEPTNSPWPYTPKSGPANVFPQGSFFEGGINITHFLKRVSGIDVGCFSSFMAETRSSTPFDSRLKDFVLGEFKLCDASIKIEPNAVNEVGVPHTFTATLSAREIGTPIPATELNNTPVTFTITTKNGAVVAPLTPLVDENGDGNPNNDITVNSVNDKATLQIVSNSAGIVEANASATVTVENQQFKVDTDPNTAAIDHGPQGKDVQAVKRFVDAFVDITGDDVNRVGLAHTFEATVKVNDGKGGGFVAAPDGTKVLFVIANAGTDAALDGTADENGDGNKLNDQIATTTGGVAKLIVNSTKAGQVTANAYTYTTAAGVKTALLVVDGQNLLRDTDTASAVVKSGPELGDANAGPAVKRYVDVRINIGDDDDNVVNLGHTFTILLERDDGLTAAQGGDGKDGFAPFAGQAVTATLLAGGVGSVTTAPGLTGADGKATVVINSAAPGTSTVSARFSGDAYPEDGLGQADQQVVRDTDPATADPSGPGGATKNAVKTWWAARVLLSPATDTNGITEAHTITATVQITKDGVTWQAAPNGTTVSFALFNNAPGATFVADGVDLNGDGNSGNDAAVAGGAGKASVQINATQAGTVDIGGAASFTVLSTSVPGPGVDIDGTFAVETDPSKTDNPATFSGPRVEKIYVAGTLRWLKVDDLGAPVGGATFLVTRTHTFNSSTGLFDDTPDVSFEGTDNNAAPGGTFGDFGSDTDADPGQLQLEGLILGRYTIKETIPPPNYTGDPDTETVNLSLTNPSNADATAGDVVPVFVNVPLRGRIAPTETTPQDFINFAINGTKDDVGDDDGFADGGFNYTAAGGVITNVSDPGIAFYYTIFKAPSSSFTVQVVQSSTNGGPEMEISDLQVLKVVGTAPSATAVTLASNFSPFTPGTDPTVTLSTANLGEDPTGLLLVLRYRVRAKSIVDAADPGVTYRLDYKTLVNGGQVDLDPNGIQVIRSNPLGLAASPPASVTGERLTQDALTGAVAEAVGRLRAAGVSPDALAGLSRLTFKIDDLSGSVLGYQSGDSIVIDADGAGYGYGESADRVDLVAVVEHELGHALGFEHGDGHDVMNATLALGPADLHGESDAAPATGPTADLAGRDAASGAELGSVWFDLGAAWLTWAVVSDSPAVADEESVGVAAGEQVAWRVRDDADAVPAVVDQGDSGMAIDYLAVMYGVEVDLLDGIALRI